MIISGVPQYGYNQPAYGLGAALCCRAFGLPVQSINTQPYLQTIVTTMPTSQFMGLNTGILNRPVYTLNLVYPLIIPVYCQLPVTDLSQRSMWSVPERSMPSEPVEQNILSYQGNGTQEAQLEEPKIGHPEELGNKVESPVASHVNEKDLKLADKIVKARQTEPLDKRDKTKSSQPVINKMSEEKHTEPENAVNGDKESNDGSVLKQMSLQLEIELYEAFDRGDNEQIFKLIAEEPYKNLVNSEGNNLLSIACQYKNYEMAKVFHEAGISPNQSSKRGNTALHIACEKGSRDLVQLLLLDKDEDGNIIEPADCLAAENPEKLTPLHCAAKHNDFILLQKLVKNLVNKGQHNQIDIRSASGHTPLMFAAYNGCSTVVSELLKYGADPFLEVIGGDDDGKIAYDFARESAKLSNVWNSFTKGVLKNVMNKYAKSKGK